ncbi:CPBP family intramembrane metalloprotease [Paenibacillus doosanensis]|uniref:CPBP family intramembrane glutamic endopeptidase n=1 Tax=Paenibacillus doosanensis TaxID=1229154 RepID=UPI00217FB851|nr:type II CAAX endopeptidase family protein [Paenibacillus doosanensis]MCS7462239.1 CPBP family intramembrane metalloprotease [Paenibacillus doosanensis]
MERKHIFTLLIFYLFVGPGPILFFLNKYTVSFASILSCIAILWLFRKELLAVDFNGILKNPKLYTISFHGLKYCIFAHAVTSFLFETPNILTDDLISGYLIMPFYAIVIAPIIEEIVYRKIIFGLLEKKFGFWIGAIVSSLIFAVGHLSPERGLAYFLSGISLCFIYKQSGTLASSILVHGSLNYISLLVRTIKG